MTTSQATANDNETAKLQRASLRQIISERSFQTGPEMKLASGRTSTIYFNMKPTMMHPDGARLIAILMLDAIADENIDLIGGLEMGAVPIASAIAAISAAQGRPVQAFFVRKKAKEHGTKSLVEGLAKGETMNGKRIVVVEDVTTTGGSAIKAVEALREDGAEVVSVVTIVDRQEGAVEAFTEAAIPFKALLTASDFTS